MRETPLGALILLELRRAEPPVRRTAVLGAGVALLITIMGLATPGRMAFIFVVLGFTCITTAVLAVTRDKVDGGLEFLVSLPVDRATLAAARLGVGGLLALGAGLCFTGAFWVTVGDALPGTSGPRLALEAFGAITGVAVLATGLGIGMSLRMRASHFANLAFVGFLATLALGEVLERVMPDGKATLLDLLGRPWFPRALAAALVLTAAGAGWLAYWLARTGLERYRPERDKMTP